MERITVAIDGPAGAGKSTVAKIVAKRLNYTYIDSGAMYRAVTWEVLRQKIDVTDEAAVIRIAENAAIRLFYDAEHHYVVNFQGRDISAAIRSPEVSRMVSLVAKIPGVRLAMVKLQREMAQEGGVVMDGRDIGTYVFPMAEVKIFLTASVEERAQRRCKELIRKGHPVDVTMLQREITCRDKQDRERSFAPLVQARDAFLVDTTAMSINDVVEAILKRCRERNCIV